MVGFGSYADIDAGPAYDGDAIADFAHEVENKAWEIQRKLKRPEGVAQVIRDWEPTEIEQVIALLAQGAAVQAGNLLEKMAYRIAEESLS